MVYKKRQEKLYHLLRTAGIDKAIAGEPTSIFFLTGVMVTPYERYYGLTIDAEQEKLYMVVPALDTGCMKKRVEEYIYQDSDGPELMIRKSVGTAKQLAVETKYFSMDRGRIFKSICSDICDLGDVLALLRMEKDEAEITAMDEAARIVDESLLYIKEQIRPGMTEREINTLLYAHMAEYPGFSEEEKIVLVQCGANSANPHGMSGNYKVRENDIILIDFCACYENYWSDITRCMFLGANGDAKLKEIYQIVKQANEKAIKCVKPGAKACEIDRAARDVITKAGYGEYFSHRTGHGLGLSVHEEPFMTNANEFELTEGMTFTIEPGIYLDGVGGVRIEDDILVTKDGCRVLTKSSKEMGDWIIS